MVKTIIGNAKVTEGRAEYEYTITGDTVPGYHTIYATYSENDNYMLGTAYNTAEIRIPTTTTVTNVMTSYGEQPTFRAEVKYGNNQPVTDGTVQFQIAGANIESPVNVVDGVAELEYTNNGDGVPSTWNDDDVITAIFSETGTPSFFGASSGTGVLNIRGDCNVTLSNISANRSTTATITATITDGDDEPVPSGEAQLYVDNTLIGTNETVSNGSVSFSYPISSNATTGGHSIKVVYLQNDTLELNRAEGTAQLIVRMPVTLTPVNLSANVGDNAPITFRVTDENNVSVTQGTVYITVGNDSAVETTVGNSGEATITYTVPSGSAGSTINFSAQYEENTNNQGATSATNGVLTVRLGTTLVVDSVKAELGDDITLGATVNDENSDEVNEGTVTYEIE